MIILILYDLPRDAGVEGSSSTILVLVGIFGGHLLPLPRAGCTPFTIPREAYCADIPFEDYIAFIPLSEYNVLTMKTLTLQTPAQLASHLRSFRKARGFTQAVLGQLTGLKQARIAKIERDPSRVSVGQVLHLLAVLNVQVLLAPMSKGPPRKASDW